MGFNCNYPIAASKQTAWINFLCTLQAFTVTHAGDGTLHLEQYKVFVGIPILTKQTPRHFIKFSWEAFHSLKKTVICGYSHYITHNKLHTDTNNKITGIRILKLDTRLT